MVHYTLVVELLEARAVDRGPSRSPELRLWLAKEAAEVVEVER